MWSIHKILAGTTYKKQHGIAAKPVMWPPTDKTSAVSTVTD